MHIIMNIPVIFKLVTIFAFILILMRLKQPLGTAFLAGACLLGLWSRMTPLEILISMKAAMIHVKTIMLNAVVVLILILSYSMDKFGQLNHLLSSFQGLIKNAKLNLVIFPTLIGLLPMPGGAIFSAPMVDILGREQNLDAESKTLINYWFRHVWEFFWPLYPGPLLIATLASVNIWKWSALSFPMTLSAIIAGNILFLSPIEKTPYSQEQVSQNSKRFIFWKAMTPITLVIFGALIGNALIGGLQRYFPAFSAIPTELPLVFFLLVSILLVWRQHHASGQDIRSILLNKAILKMIYMISTIFMFKGILEDSRAVADISVFLADQHIPPLLIVLILPWIMGMISGITVAFVGTSFPILISLLHTLGIEGNQLLAYLVLAFASGYMGVMLSPLHVCLIFTREYFNANLHNIYKHLWKVAAAIITSALLYFFLLRQIFLLLSL